MLKRILLGVGAFAVAIIALVVVLAATVGNGDIASDNAEYREAQEERLKGFHCINSLDGNHDGFEALVREELQVPGSMRTHQTSIGPAESRRHVIVMEFDADGISGESARWTAVGVVDTDTCAATLNSVKMVQ